MIRRVKGDKDKRNGSHEMATFKWNFDTVKGPAAVAAANAAAAAPSSNAVAEAPCAPGHANNGRAAPSGDNRGPRTAPVLISANPDRFAERGGSPQLRPRPIGSAAGPVGEAPGPRPVAGSTPGRPVSMDAGYLLASQQQAFGGSSHNRVSQYVSAIDARAAKPSVPVHRSPGVVPAPPSRHSSAMPHGSGGRPYSSSQTRNALFRNQILPLLNDIYGVYETVAGNQARCIESLIRIFERADEHNPSFSKMFVTELTHRILDAKPDLPTETKERALQQTLGTPLSSPTLCLFLSTFLFRTGLASPRCSYMPVRSPADCLTTGPFTAYWLRPAGGGIRSAGPLSLSLSSQGSSPSSALRSCLRPLCVFHLPDLLAPPPTHVVLSTGRAPPLYFRRSELEVLYFNFTESRPNRTQTASGTPQPVRICLRLGPFQWGEVQELVSFLLLTAAVCSEVRVSSSLSVAPNGCFTRNCTRPDIGTNQAA
ncbi:unnamed protein product [Schistocephalus solidus]|uniref:MIF4G domain-containing protein n=1 Tax=Schistocephalus solidus TaxID=70667 RepID=A0A183SSH5_SCHSO|nr:unnamed protein product [Schistocephalus solidus]